MAFDLHSNNSYLGVIDGNGKRLFKKKLPIDTGAIKRLDNQQLSLEIFNPGFILRRRLCQPERTNPLTIKKFFLILLSPILLSLALSISCRRLRSIR